MKYSNERLGPATYDEMPVKPKPGQRVRITYEAEWGCWDSIQRPVTRGLTEGSRSSRFTAPRNAQIEILDESIRPNKTTD